MTQQDGQWGPVTIGPREVYDAVLIVQADVRRVGDQTEGIREDVRDHEARIRSLERSRWPLPAIAALSGIAGVVLALVGFFRR